jgi:hypothetical protein
MGRPVCACQFGVRPGETTCTSDPGTTSACAQTRIPAAATGSSWQTGAIVPTLYTIGDVVLHPRRLDTNSKEMLLMQSDAEIEQNVEARSSSKYRCRRDGRHW